MRKAAFYLLIATVFTILGFLLSEKGIIDTTTKKAFIIQEPLLIEGEQQKNYAVLPVGTVLYVDKGWPEGHQTFHAYFHFKGDLKATAADAGVIDPLWLRTVKRDELSKLIDEFPLSKDELASILKARKITEEELMQILRDSQD